MNQEHIIDSKHPKVLEIIKELNTNNSLAEKIYEGLKKEGCKVFHIVGVNQDKSELIHEIVIFHKSDKAFEESFHESDEAFEESDEDDFDEYMQYQLNDISDSWRQHWINVVSLPHEIYSQLKNFK